VRGLDNGKLEGLIRGIGEGLIIQWPRFALIQVEIKM
jgi:hypothetical protein